MYLNPNTAVLDVSIKDQVFRAFLVENLQPLALIDEEMRFLTANTAFCSIFGMPVNQSWHKFHISVLPFANSPEFESALEMLLSNKLSAFETTVSFRSLDGKEKSVKLKMVRFNEAGEFSGGAITLQDISQQAQTQAVMEQRISQLCQQSRQLQRLVDTRLKIENLAHIAAHDLREPLRTVGNFTQLLAKRFDGQLQGEHREYFDYILQGVRQMDGLLNDIIEFSRLETQSHAIETITGAEIISHLKGVFAAHPLSPGAALAFEEMPKSFKGCRMKIYSLFAHLMENALKFKTPEEDAEIIIGGKAIACGWQFSVEDNGMGIPQEFQENIFILFKRLHGRSSFQGNGVGLAICKKIAEQHGGGIFVQSEPGQGSVFSFSIFE